MKRFVLSLFGLPALIIACGGGGYGAPAVTAPADGEETVDYEELLEDVLRATFYDPLNFVSGESEPEAVAALGETGDESLIAVLVDVVRFPWLLTPATERAAFTSLATLTDREYADLEKDQLDWGWWLGWLREHPEIDPPPGYARWKGRLFGQLVDPRIGNFLVKEGIESTIPLEEIVWGGVRRDGIPDLQEPPHTAVAKADYLEDDDRVFGVTLNGESRAYPLRIMNAHEMANDVVGGVPFALTYCTLCGSGIAYATDIGGEVLSFGTSGLLYQSNKLMYDRATETLWDQFRGVPVVGARVGSGIELEILPITLTTWGEWLELHPETTVLDDDTGIYPAASYLPEDDPRSIYFDYRVKTTTIFPPGAGSDALPEKTLVLGINAGGAAKAYELTGLRDDRVVNDMVGGVEVVVIATDNANGARAYERSGREFSDAELAGGELTVSDEAGTRWRVEEDALVAVGGGARLERLESRVSYWFAWHQAFPMTDVYE
jgi:hypothetical protein